MNFHQLLSRPFIGLDIRGTFFCLVEARTTRHGWQIDRVARQSLPELIAAEGKLKHWDLLSGTLQEWVNALELRGSSAAIQISGQLVHTQRLTLPKGLSETQMLTEVATKMRRDLPGMQDKLSIDFSTVAMDDHDVTVIATMCRQEYLLRYQQSIEAAGLRVRIIDVDAYALLRTIMLHPDHAKRDSYFVLHASQEVALLAAFHLHELVFYQSWAITTPDEFMHCLNGHAALCRALLPVMQLKSCIVLASAEITGWLQLDPIWREQIPSVDPFAFIKSSKQVDRALLGTDFLIALGLAMREVPAWS